MKRKITKKKERNVNTYDLLETLYFSKPGKLVQIQNSSCPNSNGF